MGFLIDTNVLSELRKGARCDPPVAAWLQGVNPDDLFISVLSLGEIRRGIMLLSQKDPAAAGGLSRWLGGLEVHYGDRILPISAAIADRWGRLSPLQPLPVRDGLIAATAIEHKLVVVTRDTGDFLRSGADVFNPFTFRPPPA